MENIIAKKKVIIAKCHWCETTVENPEIEINGEYYCCGECAANIYYSVEDMDEIWNDD